MSELTRLPVDEDGNPSQPRCCPGQERMEGRFMSGECPVVDVHRHKGMIRGLVLDGGPRPRALCWYPGGRLSKKQASPFDLRRDGQ